MRVCVTKHDIWVVLCMRSAVGLPLFQYKHGYIGFKMKYQNWPKMNVSADMTDQ